MEDKITELIEEKHNDDIEGEIKQEVFYTILTNKNLMMHNNTYEILIKKGISSYCVYISYLNRKMKDFDKRKILRYDEKRIRAMNGVDYIIIEYRKALVDNIPTHHDLPAINKAMADAYEEIKKLNLY